MKGQCPLDSYCEGVWSDCNADCQRTIQIREKEGQCENHKDAMQVRILLQILIV